MHPTPALLSWTPVDLINHLWQSSVIALALLILMALSLRLSARTRLALGWMALAKFAIPFGFFAVFITLLGGNPERWMLSRPSASPAAIAPVPVSRSATLEAAPVFLVSPIQAEATLNGPMPGPKHSDSGSSSPPPPPLLGSSLRPLALAVWLAGCAGLGGWWIAGGIRLRRRLLADGSEISPTMAKHLAAAVAKAGMEQLPRCLSVRDNHGPGLVGVYSPILTLPEGLEDKLTPAELESVLLHELIHFRRHDPFWLAVHVAAVSTLWFNPVAWVLSRWIRLETEKACDEAVLELTGRPEVYAQGILKVVHFALGLPEPRLLSVITPPVVSRVKNILRHESRSNRGWIRAAALAAGALLLALGGNPSSLAVTATKSETKTARTSEALSASGSPLASVSTGSPSVAGEYVPEPANPGKDPLINPIAGKLQGASYLSVADASRETGAVDPAPAELRDDPAVGTGFSPRTLPVVDNLSDNAALGPVVAQVEDEGTNATLAKSEPAPSLANPSTLGEPTSPPSSSKEHLITADFADEEISQILRKVAEVSELSLVLPETLQGRASEKYSDSTWREVFKSVLEPAGHGFVEEGNVIRVVALSPAPTAGPERIAFKEEADPALLSPVSPQMSSPDSPSANPTDTSAENSNVAFLDAARPASFFAVTGGPTVPPAEVPAIAPVNFPVVPFSKPIFQLSELDQLPAAIVNVTPVYPTDFKRRGIEGYAEVGFVVESDGRVKNLKVLSSSAREFDMAVIKAVEASKFQPGRKNGKPVATNVNRRFNFHLTDAERLTAMGPPRAVFASLNTSVPTETAGTGSTATSAPMVTLQVAPAYPAALKRSSTEGEVVLNYVVDAKGEVTSPRALSATDPGFINPAIAAVRKWKFMPGVRNGQPTATELNVTIRFRLSPEGASSSSTQVTTPEADRSGTGVFTVTTERSLPLPSDPKPYALKELDQIPMASLQVGAVYPAELKRAGVEGSVNVGFVVDQNGNVQDLEVIESSDRSFESAALTAVAKWKFKPGRVGGRAVVTSMNVTINFHLAGSRF